MIGQLIEKRYKIISQLGKGGMALVYLAEDVIEGHKVAFKILQEQLSHDRELDKRFEREFRVCSSLQHKNIVKMHEMGRLEGGALYYTMEFLDTADLESIIEAKGCLEPIYVYHIIRQMVSAFAAFHAKGITHRDLKPGNVMVCPNGRVVIVDFGLARQVDQTALTKSGFLIGTPYYMAPEVVQGEPCTTVADIYALGVIAFEMLTGVRPFQGQDIDELLGLIIYGDLPEVTEIVPELSAEWDNFIGRCMARDLEERYAKAEDMAEDLKAIGQALGQVKEGKSRPLAARKRAGKKREIKPVIQKTKEDPKDTKPADPVKLSKETLLPQRRVFVPLMFLVIASVLGVLLFQSESSDVAYDVSNLNICCEPGGAIVTWQSARPYKSKVITAKGEALQKSASVERVRKHRVALRDLPLGSNQLQVVFPKGNKSLPKKFSIARFECQLWQGEPFTLRCPAAEGATMKILYQGSARVLPCQRLGKDIWTATLPAKNIFHDNPSVVVKYGAGHSKSFQWQEIASVSAKSLIGKLTKKSAQQIVDIVNKEEDRQIAAAIEKAKGVKNKSDLTNRELAEVRRQLKSDLMKKKVHALGLIRAYEEARNKAPFLFIEGKKVANFQRKLYSALKVPIQLHNYVFARKGIPFPLAPPPPMGHFTLGKKRTKSGGQLLTVYKSISPKGTRLGTPRADIATLVHSIEGQVELTKVDDISWAELDLHCRAFDSFVILLIVNDSSSYIIYDNPLFEHRHYAKIRLSQRIPPEELKVGVNKFTFKARLLFEDRSSRDTMMGQIDLRLGRT